MPVGKDGFIDYEKLLNEELSKGIIPETNANVLLVKAFGPKPGGRIMPEVFFRRLGVPKPPEHEDYFVSSHHFVTDHLKQSLSEHEVFVQDRIRATQRPWTDKVYPRMARWLMVNEKPLAVVIKATKRSQYYNPPVSKWTKTDPGSLIGAPLPGVDICREIGSALAARAMFRVAEGKHDDAWQDLLACHRLARLVSRGCTLVEGLVGSELERVASSAELAFLGSTKLDTELIADRLKNLQSLSPVPSMADKVNTGERYIYLDSLQLTRHGGVGLPLAILDDKPNKATPEELKALAMIDWKPAITRGMRWYDRMVAAMRLPERAARLKEFARIEADLKALKIGVEQADTMTAKVVGDMMLGLLTPKLNEWQDKEDSAVQTERNLHVAFALAAYRSENGRYPAKLDDLAPKYLAKVPDDLFSAKPLIYKPTEKGYLLYSIGVDGKDSGGRPHEDDLSSDDIVVRMPLPPLKPRE